MQANDRFRIIAFVLLYLVVVSCSTETPRNPYLGNAGTRGEVGGIRISEGTAQQYGPKVIVVSYLVTNTGFTTKETQVVYGSRATTGGNGDDFQVELLGQGDQTLLQYSAWDPRKSVVEKQGIVENPEGLMVVRFPFRADAYKIRIRDKANRIVAETEVRKVMDEFCQRLKQDTDCTKLSSSQRK